MTSFGGSRMMVGVQNGSKLDMKKGKANVPPQMRGQYKKQQEMAEMRRQVMEASQPGADGLPVFNLFVRTKRQNVSHDDNHKHTVVVPKYVSFVFETQV